jgi:predicted nucleic acid-binding protein
LILIDSYGWIEYFTDGPLADSYAPYVEKADGESYITPTIVIYEVCRKIKNLQGERNALEAFAQISRTRIVELTSAISLRAADISIALKLGTTDAIILATAQENATQRL